LDIAYCQAAPPPWRGQIIYAPADQNWVIGAVGSAPAREQGGYGPETICKKDIFYFGKKKHKVLRKT